MKPITFPLIALIATGTWHYLNASKIAELRETIDKAPPADSPLPNHPVDEEKAFMTPGEGVDLEKFERYLSKTAKSEIKSTGSNAWLWIEQQFYLMSGDDLIAFLDDLEHAKLSYKTREEIEKKIENVLTRRHPEKYLRRFGVRTGLHNHSSWKAFHRFIDTDLNGAVAWFDDYVEKTNLGDKEAFTVVSRRVEFETIIARKFYPQDPATLAERFKNLDTDQAYTVISRLGMGRFPEVAQDYLKLVRDNLPEDYADALIGNRFWNTTRGKNLSEVAETIDDHHLTPGEKHAFYKSMSSSFGANHQGDRKTFETLLPFLKEQGIEKHGDIYASGLAKFFSNDLRGNGDLTPVYSYIQESGTNENLVDLFPSFVDKTTSRFCDCCSLTGRLKRISDENLKTAISNAYQQTLNKQGK